jgi:S-DNA-T family DNA segregation ATPase FtsK/SpoIIIE
VKDSLFFSAEERAFFERVIDDGLLQRGKRGVYWWVVRIALAQSLRMDGEPDARFGVVGGKDRSELHLEQITGRGKQPDLDDEMMMILSLRHERNLFDDHDGYVELLQGHARRGLSVLMDSWAPGTSFHDLLLDDLFHDAPYAEPQSAVEAGATLDFAQLQRGLSQIGVKASLMDNPTDGRSASGPARSRSRAIVANAGWFWTCQGRSRPGRTSPGSPCERSSWRLAAHCRYALVSTSSAVR